MALTLSFLQNVAVHALGGGNPASQFTTTNFVNFAGRHLFALHRWKFAERPSFSLQLVANNAFIELPSDFGGSIGITDVNAHFRETTPQHLAALGGSVTTSGGGYWYTILMANMDDNKPGAEPLPRMQLFPTPTADEANAGSIYYRGAWQNLDSANDVANIPQLADMLMLALVRAVAKGFEEDTLEDRLDRIFASSVFIKAMAMDGTLQNSYGPLSGGAAQSAREGSFNPYVTFEADQIPG